jgi:hypothetical protein
LLFLPPLARWKVLGSSNFGNMPNVSRQQILKVLAEDVKITKRPLNSDNLKN